MIPTLTPVRNQERPLKLFTGLFGDTDDMSHLKGSKKLEYLHTVSLKLLDSINDVNIINLDSSQESGASS